MWPLQSTVSHLKWILEFHSIHRFKHGRRKRMIANTFAARQMNEQTHSLSGRFLGIHFIVWLQSGRETKRKIEAEYILNIIEQPIDKQINEE